MMELHQHRKRERRKAERKTATPTEHQQKDQHDVNSSVLMVHRKWFRVWSWFIQLVNSLAVTKIIASHDLELVLQTCQRALVLEGGRLVAEGPTRSLLANRELMEAHGLEVPHSLTPHGEGHKHHQ